MSRELAYGNEERKRTKRYCQHNTIARLIEYYIFAYNFNIINNSNDPILAALIIFFTAANCERLNELSFHSSIMSCMYWQLQLQWFLVHTQRRRCIRFQRLAIGTRAHVCHTMILSSMFCVNVSLQPREHALARKLDTSAVRQLPLPCPFPFYCFIIILVIALMIIALTCRLLASTCLLCCSLSRANRCVRDSLAIAMSTLQRTRMRA